MLYLYIAARIVCDTSNSRSSTPSAADEYANEQALGAGMDPDDAIDLARTLAKPQSQGAVAES